MRVTLQRYPAFRGRVTRKRNFSPWHSARRYFAAENPLEDRKNRKSAPVAVEQASVLTGKETVFESQTSHGNAQYAYRDSLGSGRPGSGRGDAPRGALRDADHNVPRSRFVEGSCKNHRTPGKHDRGDKKE